MLSLAAPMQAGPSKAMNWYDTNGQGATHAAGPRANDQDSMNGNAVMYDTVQGLILTVGGAPSYQVRPQGSVSCYRLFVVCCYYLVSQHDGLPLMPGVQDDVSDSLITANMELLSSGLKCAPGVIALPGYTGDLCACAAALDGDGQRTSDPDPRARLLGRGGHGSPAGINAPRSRLL